MWVIGLGAYSDMVGFLCCLFVPGASPWATGADDSARYLVEVTLGCSSSGLVAQWSPPDEFDEAEAASLIPDHPMFGLMVAYILIRLLVCLLLELGSLLTSLIAAGVVVGGVMLMVLVRLGRFRLVEASVLFLGLSCLFKGPKCGGSFWLCSPLVRFTLVLIIWVLFVMLVVCLMADTVLLLLSLSMTVISSC